MENENTGFNVRFERHGSFGCAPMPRYGYRELEIARRYAHNIYHQNPEALKGTISTEILEVVADSHAATLAYTLYALKPDMDKESLIRVIEGVLAEMLSKTISHYRGINEWQKALQNQYPIKETNANPKP